jgi:hypothetical protein
MRKKKICVNEIDRQVIVLVDNVLVENKTLKAQQGLVIYD